MKVLITGARGFIGKNLSCVLKQEGKHELLEFDLDHSLDDLDSFLKEADFIVHLAGVNRPKDVNDFSKGNYDFTRYITQKLKDFNKNTDIIISSSIQAQLDNPYGISKREAEDVIFDYGKETGAKTYVYRLPNVFGKFSRPNYNSAVATFCYNVARDIDIVVNDENYMMTLVYIDDVVKEFVRAIGGAANLKEDGFSYVESYYQEKLGVIANLIKSFKKSREDLSLPDLDKAFVKKLYSTYLSFLPEDGFSYPLKMNVDNRGSFTEFIRTGDRGQFSVNISKAGITKGNHWHHTKNEKFLVVYGKGVIRFRHIFSQEILEYFVSGDKLEVVDIPPGYTHNIENLGDGDMVTLMWANESFDKDNPDTFYEEV